MFNEISVIGRVAQDPKLVVTKDGLNVVSLRVASSTWTKEGEYTTWFIASFWNKPAEYIMKNLKVGDLVHLVGTLRADRETGNPRVYKKRDGNFASEYEIKGRLITRLTKSTKHVDNNDNEMPF